MRYPSLHVGQQIEALDAVEQPARPVREQMHRMLLLETNHPLVVEGREVPLRKHKQIGKSQKPEFFEVIVDKFVFFFGCHDIDWCADRRVFADI